MAATAIALTVSQLLLPALPSIIQGVEHIFKSKSGKDKRETAIDLASVLVKRFRDQGLVPDNFGAQQVADMIETTLQVMKQTGTLVEYKDEPAQTPQPLILQPGQHIVFDGVIKTV